MFVCDPCHEERTGRPFKQTLHMAMSRGRCEVCGKTAACADCHCPVRAPARPAPPKVYLCPFCDWAYVPPPQVTVAAPGVPPALAAALGLDPAADIERLLEDHVGSHTPAELVAAVDRIERSAFVAGVACELGARTDNFDMAAAAAPHAEANYSAWRDDVLYRRALAAHSG